MSDCGYPHADGWDEYDTATCELPAGHSGPHRMEWEDHPPACKHNWGAWQPVRKSRGSLSIYDLPRTHPATKERRCKKCGEWDDDGGSYDLFPVLQPLKNRMTR